MDLVNHLLHDVKPSLSTHDLQQLNTAWGATKEDVDLLQLAYPHCPTSLISLLEKVDGTYHRDYGNNKIAVYMLGSGDKDIEYPYYLLSIQQMLHSSKEEEDISYLLEEGDDEAVDSQINSEGLLPGTYIHFSDCMNNGGTSRLFIDFNPSHEGVSGQIIRFFHDPDEYKVIANSFDEYLQQLIDNVFAFLKEEEE
ncbi:hypothetical protein A374_07989 [Fictibacillus macauensis ZFHKF-1]|uniref:Knr4/Smi1-like domain-containing protein n=1 Tax=Fictibacillus macauensis ZFHKF-1 TaxID=1196324 RepID=I8AJP5_9BACL|nr:SMI1/KNR4 family protein [Fictibacillus macauensis]EIT85759.1 hypothetical protein A374_07989 [Fictibacillus macauensis ZFHKF-1]